MPKGEGARRVRLGRAFETDVASLKNQEIDTSSSKAVDTEIGKTVNEEVQQDVPPVSLTIKVPRAYRQHWQIEAKRRNTTVTTLIVEALEEKLGLPNR